MRKFRHKVTGRIATLPEDYARAIRAFEPVEVDSDSPLIPGGSDEDTGVPETAPSAEEPFYSEEEGE